jgi:hypothetical protein
MPFRSKSQMRACFAKHDSSWDCHKWAHETPNRKSLPDRLKKKLRGGEMMQDGGSSRRPPDQQNWLPPSGWLPPPDPNYLGNDAMPNVNFNDMLPQGQYDSLDNARFKGVIGQPQDLGTYKNMPRKRRGWDPQWKYDELKALQNVAGYIGSNMDRHRQNNYLGEQLFTLGQIDALPVENFQPNPYNLYARLGGSLRRFQRGGFRVPLDNIPHPVMPHPRYNMSTLNGQPTKDDSLLYNINFEGLSNDQSWAWNQLGKYNQYGVPFIGPNGSTDKEIYAHDTNQYNALQDSYEQMMNPESRPGYGASAKWNMQKMYKYKRGGRIKHHVRDTDRDNDMMNDKDMDEMKKGGINPAHRGWCTPMTKSTCTGKRRQFALNMKKMARANRKHG